MDTSFILGLLTPTDAHHAEAKRLFGSADRLLVQQTALVETLLVLRHRARQRHGKAAGLAAERRALQVLLDTFRLHVTGVADLDLARRIHEEHHELSFVDACGIADARSAGGLLTFDQNQKRLADAL